MSNVSAQLDAFEVVVMEFQFVSKNWVTAPGHCRAVPCGKCQADINLSKNDVLSST